LKKNRTVKEFQVTLEQTLLSLPLSFSKDITIDNHTPQYRDRKIMTLQMNRQPDNNVYLRGKIGTVYAQGAWKGKNDHFSSEYEESGFPKADIGFWYQTGYMSQKDAVNKKVSYTIDYDITTDISYRPYFTDALQVSDSEYLFQDEGFRKKRANKTTAFIGCPVPDFSKDAAIASNTNIQTTYEDSDNDLLKWYETYVQDVYAVPQKEMPSVTAFAEQIQTKELPETFMIEGNRRTMENMYRIKTAEQVRLELAKQCSYRLQLDSIKDGTDTVEYFLSKSHKGYCTHFASAGVFLLRQLQIPARYVSGYVISKESFKVQADGNFKAQVIDRNAHAWVEIYLNEIGWVPVDMTPGYAQNPSILPTQMSKEQLAELEKESNASYPDKETSKETAQEKKEETVTHKKTNAETETQKQKNQKESRLTNQTGTAQKQKKTIPGKVLGFWLVFLIAASGIILVRRYIFWYQNILNDEYKTKSYSKMIQRINRRIYHAFLWKKKQLHSSLTDEEYALALSEVFTELTVDEWKQYVQILQKTCFSQDLLLSDDAAFCYRLYHRVMERK
ncbi:MAG: transglutaminase family protein, partial [Lachnospiraceae bacterium]